MKAVSTKSMESDVRSYMQHIGQRARAAARAMSRAATADKDKALLAMASEIERQSEGLLSANRLDMDAGKNQGLDAALLDRLELNSSRIKAMADGLRQIAALADPVGEITDLNYRPSGIQVGRMRVPLGVIGIIYESRPNVTADAAGLCRKSGNATILRGGSEAIHSNRAIAACIHAGLKQAGLPEDAVQVIETTDRAAVGELIRLKGFVDVIVPRGGKSLIERISNEATIPVIKHLHGVCHVYIDDKANLDKAVNIAINAKTQRYGTCNTMETLLVARAVANQVLPVLGKLYREKGVELRGCAATQKILSGIKAATEEDWHTEYLAPILSIRVVENLDEAMDHIGTYGSSHTESIVTDVVNASTRFADGFEYGLGAEIGISTDKLHARGPVGLEGLTSVKFVVLGDGHIRG